MKKEIAVEFKNVSKIYSLKSKEKNHKGNQQFYALKDLSFTIEKGEVVGILGTNGSGKSTLSVILAGISEVDEGEVIVKGEQAMIAINVGLNLQLTGIQNIEYKGALLGLSKKRIDEIKQGVIDFAEIGDFMYQPVKKYSSGMRSRLGFAINLCLDPDVLIVDEALSVGDKGFAEKCIMKMNELRTQGKTIVFISHALPQIRSFCTKALWIEGGFLKEYGEVEEVCDHYADYVEYYNHLSSEEKSRVRDEKFEKRIIPGKRSWFQQWFG